MPKKIDLSELFGKKIQQDDRVFHKQVVNVYELYLSGELESPEEYIQWFDIIRHAGDNDVIKIYINCPGGDAFTAIQFLRVLSETAAQVVVSVEGMCASAATMIMLGADSYEISEHSTFMIHNYSGGLAGKGHEMYAQADYEKKWSSNLLKKIYENFLTDEEIEKVANGTDLWMDGSDVIARLEKRKEIMEKEEESGETEKVSD